jgi:acetoacetyl-CoA synthetase
MAVEIWNDAGPSRCAAKRASWSVPALSVLPVGFWNDPDGERFHAGLLRPLPGVWAHGDYAELTAHGGFVIHGRSDAVLNPGGVRIGTAEIYRQVEGGSPRCSRASSSASTGPTTCAWCCSWCCARAATLDEDLCARIRRMIRDNTTPRHVPAKIVQVADIPRTISGKIVELAVRNVVHGEAVKNTDALANPEALALYRDLPELRD